MQLDGKRILITGAAGDIGKAIAKEALALGATACLTDINPIPSPMDTTEVHMHRADLSKSEDIVRLFAFAKQAMGGLDLLINNAGVCPFGAFAESTLEQMQQVLTVNLRAVYLCSREAIRIMQKQGSGLILNISSNLASSPLPGQVLYSSTKRAATCLTTALADEAAPWGITVTAIEPGAIDTNMARNISGTTSEQLNKNIIRQRPEAFAQALLMQTHIAPLFPVRKIQCRTQVVPLPSK